MSYNEADTRAYLIDPQLEKVGWYLRDKTKVGIEIPVDGYDAEPWNGVTDYILLRENGEILAVVEAKKACVDVRLAEAQLIHYVTEIAKHQSFQPFGFLANGYEIYFQDVGMVSKRLVSGFFSSEDLENMLYIKQHGKPLADISIDNHIVDRTYQHEAIRRVGESFAGGKRKTLIVMATGTGKTRTAMALIDLFMRADQARKVLFVADRDALVEQAKMDGFEKFLPQEPCTRLYSWNIDTTQRLYAVTLQTLSNIFEQFSPVFFDLIVFDEVHRSIFNKFNEVLQYFDGRMVGLTATPAQYIDRDTFREFECHDGKPTYLYTYEQAVDDEYLVDYSLYSARTRFQRQGIKGVDLSEEDRNSLIEQGIDPDELDFEGTDLEEKVSNRDTLRRQWEEIMEVCIKDGSRQLPGKTIVFTMTQKHALRLQAAFDEMYPQFPNLSKAITHKSEYRGTLIDAFKKQDQPRIAISVDMLDTGVDVPEVVNLVFMKPVHSPIKLMQMIVRAQVKTDKKAALALAQLHAAGLLPGVWIPPEEVREMRALVAHRRKMVKLSSIAKCRLHALLHRHHIEPDDIDLFSSDARSWWEALEVGTLERSCMLSDLATLSFAREQVKQVEAALNKQIAKDPRAPLLVQITGVGLLTAVVILSAIGDINRFPSPKKLVGYAGLGSRVHASGDKHYTGKISKNGRKELRWALITSAWVAVRFSVHWRKQFQRLSLRLGKQKAITAVARKLLVTIWHILSKKEADRFADPQAVARSMMTWSSQHHLARSLDVRRIDFVKQGLEWIGIADQVQSFKANGRMHYFKDCT